MAQCGAAWQGEVMPAHRPSSAGGFPLAVGTIGGAAIGFAVGQQTLWFLGGTAAGVAVALLVWWRGQ